LKKIMSWSSEDHSVCCVILPTPVCCWPLGFALSLRNWAVLFVVLLPIGAAFIHRMNVEEDALSRALGRRYADYMKRTKRLVPFLC
jgi:protein-S-isoprenylcysteine O-methyltransferase Ste14